MKSLSNKVAVLKACNFIKKRFQHTCFPENIAKFLRTHLFYRTPPVSASDNPSMADFGYGDKSIRIQNVFNPIVYIKVADTGMVALTGEPLPCRKKWKFKSLIKI